jgi:hypothetical protein
MAKLEHRKDRVEGRLWGKSSRSIAIATASKGDTSHKPAVGTALPKAPKRLCLFQASGAFRR